MFPKALPICFALFLIAAATACRKDKTGGNNNTGESTETKVVTMLKTQTGAAAVYQEKWGATGDTAEALNAMCNWIIAQPQVSRAYLMTPDIVRIEYTNGLASNISLIPADASGKRLMRGGSAPGGGEGYKRIYTLGGHNKGTSEMIIKGNKVLVFAPYIYEFYHGLDYPFLQKFDEAPQALEVTVVTEKAANLEELKKVDDYGLVILDTHGLPGAFCIYTGSDALDGLRSAETHSDEEWKAALKDAENYPEAKILNGELELMTGVVVPPAAQAAQTKVFHSVLVTYKYIRSSLPMLDEAVVYGNHCYSGGKMGGTLVNNLATAWMDRGAISYYGYAFQDGFSLQVLNDFCVQMEDSLITNLMRSDSTGIAHLAGDAAEQFYIADRRRATVFPLAVEVDAAKNYFKRENTPEEFFFKHFHDPRYSYGCGTFTDPRDGEKYKLACIGDQVWMAENLRYNAPGSTAYDNVASNAAIYGRLYSYPVVSAGQGVASTATPGIRGICPQGWHIPSRYDYDKMIAALTAANGGVGLGTQLKAKSALWLNDATLGSALRDKSGFAAMPGGFLDDPGPGFVEKGESAIFWLSSRYATTAPENRAFISLFNTSADVDIEEGDYDGNEGISCRCLKD